MRLTFALLTGILFSVNVSAKEASTALKDLDRAPEFEVLGLKPLSSTLEDVVKTFGEAKPHSNKDHGHEFKALCYKGPAGEHVVFEQGFFVPKTLGRTVISASSELPKAHAGIVCSDSAKVTSELKMANGLRLGLSRAEVKAIMGKPTKRRYDSKGETWRYYLQYYHPFSDEERAKKPKAPGGKQYKGEYHYLTVEGRFNKDKLLFLEAYLSGETDW